MIVYIFRETRKFIDSSYARACLQPDRIYFPTFWRRVTSYVLRNSATEIGGEEARRVREKESRDRPPLLDRQFVTRQGSYQALPRRGCTCRHVVKAGPKDKRVALSRRINYQFLPERFLTFRSAGRGKRYRRETLSLSLPLSFSPYSV